MGEHGFGQVSGMEGSRKKKYNYPTIRHQAKARQLGSNEHRAHRRYLGDADGLEDCLQRLRLVTKRHVELGKVKHRVRQERGVGVGRRRRSATLLAARWQQSCFCYKRKRRL